MNEMAHPSQDRCATFKADGPFRAAEPAGRPPLSRPDSIGHALEAVRVHIDRAIRACSASPSWRESAEPDLRRHASPLRPAEIGVLRRLGPRLDRVAARYRSSAGLAEVRGTCESLAKFDRALAAHAEAMNRRFDGRQVGRDLLEDLESDLWIIEQLMDERASSLSNGTTRPSAPSYRGNPAAVMPSRPPEARPTRAGADAPMQLGSAGSA